ncbi:hypothetical protein J2793_001975 [Paraburkholderia caledonica]|uniref:Uncharacterized protein n=1 Tax=Paraburkholderia caledonica TaxID=134536 RepID=A0AB73IAZ0_9BURK|nr:hypothetical protein [Paraburkholderia caledonica]
MLDLAEIGVERFIGLKNALMAGSLELVDSLLPHIARADRGEKKNRTASAAPATALNLKAIELVSFTNDL